MGDDNAFSDGSIEITWGDTVADAKEVLDKLKTNKASLQADKREIAAQLAEIRAEYRERVAHRIPVRSRRGLFGNILRSSRAVDRAGTNERVRPLERRKQGIDEALVSIDRATAHVKGWIAERGGSPTPRTRTVKQAADDPVATLGRLADLRDRGAITAEEYETKKAELLSRM